MLNSSKDCNTCGAWQSMEDGRGQCRRNAPSMEGWPWTSDTDWCCQWIKDVRPKPVIRKKQDVWQVGINYVFVRDYPELVSTWLLAATTAPEHIPEALRPVLADLFGSVLTVPMPHWQEQGPSCEAVLSWAEQFPGFSNDDTATDDDDYCGLLSMVAPAEIAASQQALAEIPADHPWRARK